LKYAAENKMIYEVLILGKGQEQDPFLRLKWIFEKVLSLNPKKSHSYKTLVFYMLKMNYVILTPDWPTLENRLSKPLFHV